MASPQVSQGPQPTPSQLQAWRAALRLDFPDLDQAMLDWLLFLYQQRPQEFGAAVEKSEARVLDDEHPHHGAGTSLQALDDH